MADTLANIRNICIVVRHDHTGAEALGREVADWLERRKVGTILYRHEPGCPKLAASGCAHADLVLVLGGDGTFLSVAGRALAHGVPLLGINLGRVGFLTRVCPKSWRSSVELLLDGKARVEERLALAYQVERAGETVHVSVAVNDLVAGRGSLARLVGLSVAYGGISVGRLRCDGLIVSTPTGSTAYTVSAGGPLLHPLSHSLAITPVCPFRNDFPPMVLPADKEVVVTVDEPMGEVSLTEDGQRITPLETGDKVRINASDKPLKVVSIPDDDHFKTLAEKGFLTER